MAANKQPMIGFADVTRRVQISETHHMPNMEKLEAFNQIVLDFLRER
jgi:hypothetical protein